jgi:hypothetical protein
LSARPSSDGPGKGAVATLELPLPLRPPFRASLDDV